MKPFKVNHVVVCDDVRREDNGKLLFIGVYSADMLVPSFPANLSLAIALISETRELGPIPISFRLSVGGKHSQEGKSSVKFDQLGKTTFVLKPIPISADEPTTIEFQLKQADEEWETIASIPIKKLTASST